MGKFILRLTHRLWNRRISSILCRAYSAGEISSETLHKLTAKFDPTQKHEVY
jgi:hypothetical protein